MRTGGGEGGDRPEDDKVIWNLRLDVGPLLYIFICLVVHLPCTDQMRGGKGQDGRGRRQSWGSLRRDVEGRVWWEGEGMRYGVLGKVEGEGRMEKC